MPSALAITGEMAGAATALAGLILVFLGATATSFDAYQKQEQTTVRARYQVRAWIAFVGFVLALASTLVALLAKWFSQECAAITAFVLLLGALGFVLLAALSAVREIK